MNLAKTMLTLVGSNARAAAVAALLATSAGAQQDRVSRPGEYRGYSAPTYDGYRRTSFYVPMRDGVRLAVDLLRPTRNGQLPTERLPVVWTHHRYNRAFFSGDTLVDYASGFGRGIDVLLHHGYIVAAVDTRGGGASFGTQQGFFMPEEAADAREMTEWLAVQPWSSGKVGMTGRSYLGITQLFAAAQAPPHLVAIFPEMYVFEWWPFIHPGGIFRDDFFTKWQYLTRQLDNAATFTWGPLRFSGVAPVDGPTGRAQRDTAIRGHTVNRDMFTMWRDVPFRDSRDPVSGREILAERSPSTYLKQINASGVAVYGLAGWMDAFPRDAFLWHANLTVPQKLVVGPWFHGQTTGFDLAAERLRWFDYWLKGIDNGIMREPPIRYHVMEAPAGREWRSTRSWPPAGTRRTSWFLAGARGSDKSLAPNRPRAATAADSQVVDTTASLGPGNRWANTYGGDVGYPDLAPNDAKGFAFTSAPLSRPMEVIGHPIVHLWITSSTRDADLMVTLSDVDPTGRSTYVTEGVLRASRRAQGRPPYRNLGLPWPSGRSADVRPLGDAPEEVTLDLLPTARHFKAGHRIRLTINGADRQTHLAVPNGAPMLTLFRDARHPSRVDLPIGPTTR
ncbi:MAG: CocE/NonD family hydrolase [Gemmatimonadetes bacterium]|nr:CocE/NonD family hydrolase [Gemmatimonadota bacterium]